MKKVLMSVLAIGAFLAGCGESDASASEGSSSWLGKSLELDITAKPHFNNNFEQSNRLVILSKNDEQVKITDVIVNRGNCYVNIGSVFDKYTANKERFKEFFEKHPEYDFIKEGKKLPTKDGRTVEYNPYEDHDMLDSNLSKDMEYYNNLAPEAQALYDKEHKDTRKVLGFGQEYAYRIGCSYDNVLEVTIKTDKGEVSYKMGR
ncbi:hypothetical protein [Helicobacter sp.]|uniref:hypothetical protein n=1 Tax=Helicobacter sp. TaxID=218 RepID=UPI001998EE5D|nr:hypothetical protein [Helicobacter sp.]MBD5164847.1 hypothetical protein [Helicobacter sp.]